MAYRQDLLLYYLSQPNVKYISGHFSFSGAAYQEFESQWRFVTLLRHPVDRWLSQYFYNKYKVSAHTRVKDDLSAYLETEEGVKLGRIYAKLLTDGTDWSACATSSAVDEAIANLDQFSLVGCLERLDDTIKRFADLFGVELQVLKSNENPCSDEQRDLEATDSIRSRVQEICAPDLLIYQHALEMNAGS